MTKNFKIILVDDEDNYRETSQMLLEQFGYTVTSVSSAEEALEIMGKEYHPLVITDIVMQGMNGIDFLQNIKKIYQENVEVIMVTGYGSVETAVQTIKMGAFGYFIKSHNPEELIIEIEKARKIIELRNAKENNPVEFEDNFLLTSKNPKMQKIWEMVDKVADSNANILITGESGVGKEIVAKQLHICSSRREKPFIAVNCQQYPDALIESELFGHEKGAFTGAVFKRIGKLETTSGGTIFLDEIGDMNINTQIKLLRVLETRTIERIGSNHTISVDFRLVSATNRDIYSQEREGNFRKDFLYRINTIEINIPPLRDRREDLEDLIPFFVNKYAKETGKKISSIDEKTRSFLYTHDYPGNVRELKNIIERMVILSDSPILHLDCQVTSPCGTEENLFDFTQITYREAKRSFEKKYISEMLLSCNGNITRAAEKMGISRRQLFNKIAENNLDTQK